MSSDLIRSLIFVFIIILNIKALVNLRFAIWSALRLDDYDAMDRARHLNESLAVIFIPILLTIAVAYFYRIFCA